MRTHAKGYLFENVFRLSCLIDLIIILIGMDKENICEKMASPPIF